MAEYNAIVDACLEKTEYYMKDYDCSDTDCPRCDYSPVCSIRSLLFAISSFDITYE